ncbi:MAG: nucleotidyltransferase family protein, partial [Oscillospiraceae bacterium]|nr:nucleotidyltransferase family protein [Oscillospiraceae bacterium]
MKAVILAGGLGTRLRPVTGEHPKPMAPVLGRPMMEHIVELLRRSGYTQICAALHYRAGEIMAHFGDGRNFGVELEYRIETDNLGTAGSVKNCRDFYRDEDFLVISA